MNEANPDELLSQLTSARDRLKSASDALSEFDIDSLETLEEQLTRFDRMLTHYEDRATGSGDFAGYVSFRGEIDAFIEGLPPDLPHRQSFETVGEIVDKRRLSHADFEAARSAVSDARSSVRKLDAIRSAEEEYREQIRKTHTGLEAIEKRIEEYDHLLHFEDIDLDAPIDTIREPITTYNRAVTSDFSTYLQETPVSEVFALLSLSPQYPLIPMPRPPEHLQAYIEETALDMTIPELIEFSDYSRSKLEHYVEHPDAFRAAVTTERTFLERLDSTAFRIDWPPPPANRLRWIIRELIPIVNRFASSDVVTHLRTVRGTTADGDSFDRLRTVAEAIEQLSDADRQRLEDGVIAAEREHLVSGKKRLEEALNTAPID